MSQWLCGNAECSRGPITAGVLNYISWQAMEGQREFIFIFIFLLLCSNSLFKDHTAKGAFCRVLKKKKKNLIFISCCYSAWSKMFSDDRCEGFCFCDFNNWVWQFIPAFNCPWYEREFINVLGGDWDSYDLGMCTAPPTTWVWFYKWVRNCCLPS